MQMVTNKKMHVNRGSIGGLIEEHACSIVN